jgi:hypothetical protein
MVGAAVGLCVSARASTTEAAIAMLPLILLPVIALGGGLSPVRAMHTPMPQIAKITPSRWAFEANLVIESNKTHHDGSSCDSMNNGRPKELENNFKNECDGDTVAEFQFPAKDQTPFRTSYAVLGGMLVFWIGVALLFLRMRDLH